MSVEWVSPPVQIKKHFGGILFARRIEWANPPCVGQIQGGRGLAPLSVACTFRRPLGGVSRTFQNVPREEGMLGAAFAAMH
jgi:hypothetical protein